MRQANCQFDRRLCGCESDHAKRCNGSGTAEWVAPLTGVVDIDQELGGISGSLPMACSTACLRVLRAPVN
jgi:hypothetical protein